jgi:hypothetical protein
MDINSFVEQENNASDNGEGSSYGELKENFFKIPDGETILKFKSDAFFPSYEVWIKPSDNLPEGKDPEKTLYAFRLKNAETHNLLAEIFGAADKWGINARRRLITYGQFKGGLYEFEYTDRKNKDGFAIKKYRHLHKPENKEFFMNFAFRGEMYDMDSSPKVTPSLRFYAGVYVPEDQYCKEKHSWRHIQISYKLLTMLIDYQKEGYDLSSTWFKIKREGSGLQTKYNIIPLSPKLSVDYSQSYNTTDLLVPDLNLATKLSTNAYCWKYLQSYIREADRILGTKYSEVMQREYEERQASESSSIQDQSSSPRSVPSVVKEEVSTGSSADADVYSGIMSDDDIPF